MKSFLTFILGVLVASLWQFTGVDHSAYKAGFTEAAVRSSGWTARYVECFGIPPDPGIAPDASYYVNNPPETSCPVVGSIIWRDRR